VVLNAAVATPPIEARVLEAPILDASWAALARPRIEAKHALVL
jgi:hypothetical protein